MVNNWQGSLLHWDIDYADTSKRPWACFVAFCGADTTQHKA